MSHLQTATQYANDIISGIIPASKYTQLSCKRYLADLKNPKYYYDNTEVDKVIAFISALKLSDDYSHMYFQLSDWQIYVIVNIYGLYRSDNHKRKYKNIYIEVARKNAKSQLIAAFAMYHLLFDANSQVVLSANSREQAKNVDFKKVKEYSTQLDPKQKSIKQHFNMLKFQGSELLVTASDAGRLDGLSVSLGIIDELHEAKSSDMYNVIKSSMGARLNPLLMVITTSGFNTESFCYQLRSYTIDVLNGVIDDPSQFSLIYSIDEDDDITKPDTWQKANPNLSISVDPDYIRGEVLKAEQNPSERAGVLVKHFNQWLKSSTDDIWIPEQYIVDAFDDISLNDEYFDGYPVWVGVDLSSVSDITAVSYMIKHDDGKYYFFNDYYLPENSLNSATNRQRYKEAAARGEIYLVSEDAIDYDRIMNDILSISEHRFIEQVSYDKHNAIQWAINLTEAGLYLVQFSQSNGNMNAPLKEFERLMLTGQVVIQRNSLTKWMFNNAIPDIDKFGNYKIDKSSRNKKVDGVHAIADAIGGYLAKYASYV